MEGLTKAEYAAILPFLQPTQAVHVYNDRLKKVVKLSAELADWLQERRRIEDQYVQSLRKLSSSRPPNDQSELGAFRPAWQKIVSSIDQTAIAHQKFSSHIDKDIEGPLRAFSTREDVRNLHTIQSNLNAMAKELEDAQEKTEKLSRKGSKSAAKLEQASAKLESAITQWESQAPFVFESLQTVDESRTNQLRDLLTQYETMDVDCCQSSANAASEAISVLLEFNTESEIDQFVSKTTDGRARATRPAGRNGSVASSTGRGRAASAAPSHNQADNVSIAPSHNAQDVALTPQTPVQRTQTSDRPPHTPVSRTTSHHTLGTPGQQVATPSSRHAPSTMAPPSSHSQVPPTSSSGNAPPTTFDSLAPPMPPVPSGDDDMGEFGGNSGGIKQESSLRNRFSSMIGRRRQSLHNPLAGFSQLGAHARPMGGSHGRVSPRASINDMSGSRLSSLSETAKAHRG